MLSYVDQSGSIKVFRIENGVDGHVTRERLGVIRKKDFSLDEHLEGLPAADKSNIEEVISFYNQADKYDTLAALHSLPCTLRKVIDHVVGEGSKTERDLVMMSLVEALRVLRKVDRDLA